MQEQWRHVDSTRGRHWQRVGSRAAADNAWKQADLAWLLLLFPFTPAVTSNVTCKAKKMQPIVNFVRF